MKMKSLALGIAATLALIPAVLLAQEAPKKSDAPVLCVVRGSVIVEPAKAPANYKVGEKTYYVCCGGCKAKFEGSTPEEKAKFAKVTDLKTEKVVLQKRMEAVDAELKSLAEPAKAPAATTTATAPSGKLFCAMTDEEIASADEAGGGKSDFKGKTYYFCCPSCKKTFDKDPAKYAAEADKRAASRKN